MTAVRTLDRSFASGEISPELYSRVDLAKFQTGLASARNFVTLPHGPARNRVGTQFVKEVGNSANVTRLIPFSYNNTQTFAIELGAGFIRWHSQGGTLLAGTVPAWSSGTAYTVGGLALLGGRNYYCIAANTNQTPPNSSYWYAMPADGTYEIPNAFAASELFDVHYVQSADVLTLVHPAHAPVELRRYGATNWQIAAISFVPTINAPSGLTLTTAGPGGGTPVSLAYVVSAVSGSNNLDQSLASSPAIGSTVKTISGVTQANPGVVSSTLHGFAAGDVVYISGVVGMTQLNGNYYTVGSPAANTFALLDSTGANVDTTAFTAWSSGGTATLAGVKYDLSVTGNSVTVTWNAVAGAQRYNVYKYSNGLYGYIGQAGTTTFKDTNITADISQTPPTLDTTLAGGAGYYPAAVGYFQQRRAFAGWSASPQSLLATRSGTESNVAFHIPSVGDDRLALRIAAREASAIRHIVPVQQVVLLTATNEFAMSSSSGGAITASTVTVAPQAYVGANNVQPTVVGSSVLYAASRGGRVRELAYNWQAQSYLTNDVSLMAPHLFDYKNLVDMAFSRAPYPILWAVNDSGQLLGMTYVPEQQISGWHHHDTINGAFESVCTVTENNEDMVYVIVRRTIGGATKRYVERFVSRNFATQADNYFVDCGATYSGAATTTISGLSWLEGQTVSILGDGAVMPQCVVTGGAITLQQAVSKAQVGLPITADLQTLPFSYMAMDFGQGRPKNINKVFLRVVNSSGVFAGPDANSLVQYAQRTVEPWGTPPALVTDEIEIVLNPSWTTSGQLFIRQSDPLPLTVVSAALEVAVGG